jgi:hypothetical protein
MHPRDEFRPTVHHPGMVLVENQVDISKRHLIRLLCLSVDKNKLCTFQTRVRKMLNGDFSIFIFLGVLMHQLSMAIPLLCTWIADVTSADVQTCVWNT